MTYLYGAGAVLLAFSLRALDWSARSVVPRGFLPRLGFGIVFAPL